MTIKRFNYYMFNKINFENKLLWQCIGVLVYKFESCMLQLKSHFSPRTFFLRFGLVNGMHFL